MEPSTSESEQDGGVTSGEESSFERPNVSNSVHSETDSHFSEQSAPLPYRTNVSTTSADNYAGMMIANSYLPFMMQQSYQSAMQGTNSLATTTVPYAAANAFFFNQNSSAKDVDGLAAAGSPLNLQMPGGQTERPRIVSGHSDFNGATVPQQQPQQQQQQHGLPATSPSPGLQHARASPHVVAGSSYASPAHQPAPNAYAGVTANSLPGQGQFPGDIGYAKTDSAAKPTEYPPPPKKPLTPYMRFNKFMWEKVKASNPSMGVCEISASIGRMWRELGPEDKQRHNDEYTLDKGRYDEELKVYLKMTGLRSADLVKQKPKKSKPAPQRRPAAAPASLPPAMSAATSAAVPADLHHQQSQQHAQVTANRQQQQQQQQLQALMGLPGSLPLGMPVSFQNMGMLGGFPQMWATAAGQPYAGGLVNASQLHELYGGVNGAELPPPAHNQQSSSAPSDTQSSALYRYPQGFM